MNCLPQCPGSSTSNWINIFFITNMSGPDAKRRAGCGPSRLWPATTSGECMLCGNSPNARELGGLAKSRFKVFNVNYWSLSLMICITGLWKELVNSEEKKLSCHGMSDNLVSRKYRIHVMFQFSNIQIFF